VYLDVVPITGSEADPRLGGDGEAIEWALRMREFPQDALLSQMAERGALTPVHVDALAASVAVFHARAHDEPPDPALGSPRDVLALALDNLPPLRSVLAEADERRDLDALEAWTRSRHAALHAIIASRRDDGYVRECHGDLHLRNIALVDGAIVPFDCIEFSEHLRWIDVVSEIAFTAMDLRSSGHPELAHRFANAYFEATGDYRGVALLPFYLVYRALVRAKVAALRTAQAHEHRDASEALADCRAHVALASAFSRTRPGALVVTHGFSGSGKTTITQALVDRLGAIRIRTDVERKRLHGLAANARSGSPIAAGLYSAEATQRVYEHVASAARSVLAAGFVTIVDGAFLRRWQRERFRALATELGLRFLIASFAASDATLRERIASRSAAGGDASEATLAVLDAQQREAEPLHDDERSAVMTCDADQPSEAASARLLEDLVRQLAIDPTTP
jgi:aminoglycoside phosphotransferase family enzyme/predicted kinase